MAILDKKLLLDDLKARYGEYIPAALLDRLINDAGEAMTKYEVTAQRDEDDDETSQLIGMFLDAKELEGKSRKTIEQYRYRLQRLHEETSVSFRKITVYHLRQYLMQEKTRGLKPKSLNNDRDVWSSCFGWLYKEGLIDSNPCANLAAAKVQAPEIVPFEAKEIQLLREAAKDRGQRAIIEFLLSTGCRISELCGANIADVDFRNMKLDVVGKGNKRRTVYIDDITEMMLRRYLDERKDRSPALFVSRYGERYTQNGVRAMLKTLAERAGVENVFPHRFRHTLATNLIDRGMSVQEVAKILGHENINTTMIYVYINQRAIENNYRKCRT